MKRWSKLILVPLLAAALTPAHAQQEPVVSVDITDISVLLEMASGDSSGARRFSPFWRVYLYGNPLSEKATQEQLPALKNISAKVTVEKPQ